MTADADAEKWARDIASGKVTFQQAARSVSIGPNAEGGGDLGFMALSDMAPGMLDQVSRMKKGDVSPLLSMNATKVQIALLDFEEAEIHFRTRFAELTLAEYRTAMLLERSEFELKRGNAELAAGYLKEASGNPGAGKRFKARMETIRKKLLPYDQKGS